MAERAIEVRIIGDSSQLERAFGKASAAATTFEGRMKTVGASATRAGSTMTRDLTVPIVAAGVASAKMAIDFQQQMLLIQTQAGASAGEVKKMTGAVLELAKTAPQGPVELARGLYHLESIGMRGNAALKALKESAMAAGMGIANLEDVTTALGGAVVTGIKGTKDYTEAMGILNATIGSGNMRMSDLAPALGKVVPMAKLVGLDLKEVGAAMATLTDRGIPAEQAATMLAMSFAKMANPTKAGAKALSDLGISATQLANMMRSGPNGLGNALELIAAGMTKLNDKTRATQDVLTAFGGGKMGKGILTLVESLDQGLSSYSGKLGQVDKQTKDFLAHQGAYMQSTSYKLAAAWSSIQADMIKVGTSLAPVAVTLAHDFSKVADAIAGLSPGERKMLEDTVAFLAVLGPGLLVVGKFAKAIAAVTAATKTLGLVNTATQISGIGAAAATAEGEISGLRAGLLGLGRLGEIGVTIGISYELLKGITSGKAQTLLGGGGHKGESVTNFLFAGDPVGQHLANLIGLQGSWNAKTPSLPSLPANNAVPGAYGPYGPVAAGAATKYGVPAAMFLRQINQESGFQAGVTSKAGAEGIAQFMPGTAAGFGINPMNPEQALPAAAKMMSQLHAKYKDWGLALAAYNAGSGTVDKYLAGVGSLPKETQAYVAAILGHPLSVNRAASASTPTFNPAANLGTVGGSPPLSGSTKTVKAKIATGTALLPPELTRAIAEATSSANAATGTVALTWLKREQADLEKAKKTLHAKLGQGSTAQQNATRNELTAIDGKLKEVGKNITDNLKAQAAAIRAAFSSQISTDQSAVSNAFSRVKADLDAQLQAIFQKQIDQLGAQYFQGGAKTPLEQQLAGMQQADQLQSLQDAVANATDPAARAAAQRQLDEYNLSIKAAAERAQADRDYTEALKRLQTQQALTQQKLDDQLDLFNTGLLAGTQNMGDLQGIVSAFGLTLSDIADPNTGLGYDFSVLSDATQTLAKTMLDEAAKLASVGDSKDAAAIAKKAGGLGTIGGGGGGGPVLTGAGVAPRAGRAVFLAAGGVVTQPTLAVIGEAGPEAVVPLDSAGIGGGTIEIPVYLDGQVLTRVVADTLGRDKPSARRAAAGLKPHLDRIVRMPT